MFSVSDKTREKHSFEKRVAHLETLVAAIIRQLALIEISLQRLEDVSRETNHTKEV